MRPMIGKIIAFSPINILESLHVLNLHTVGG